MQLSVNDLLQVIQNFRIRNFLRTPFSVLRFVFLAVSPKFFVYEKFRPFLSGREQLWHNAVSLHGIFTTGSCHTFPEQRIHEQVADSAQSVLYLSMPVPKVSAIPFPPGFLPLRLLVSPCQNFSYTKKSVRYLQSLAAVGIEAECLCCSVTVETERDGLSG